LSSGRNDLRFGLAIISGLAYEINKITVTKFLESCKLLPHIELERSLLSSLVILERASLLLSILEFM
jgi:hypothetical protein